MDSFESSVDPLEAEVEDEGHDIGPDEIWGSHPQESRYRTVQMLVNTDDMEVAYETVYVENHRYIDHTPTRPWTRSCETEAMYDEERRLRTFNDLWLDSFSVTKEDCARNGFFYIGPYDKVKCAFCLRTLYGWEEGDSVEGEHRNHYPECPFVTGECLTSNVPIGQARADNVQNTMHIKMKTDMKYPEYMDQKERLKTFENWAYSTVSADGLANAGFFYTGKKDATKCFYCGKVIGQWEKGDNPLEEHVKWYPDCKYAKEKSSIVTIHSSESNSGACAAPLTNGLHTSTQKTSDPLQCTEPSQSILERDLASPAAKAVLEHGIMNIEDLTRALQELRIRHGTDSAITSKDILNFEMDKK